MITLFTTIAFTTILGLIAQGIIFIGLIGRHIF